MNKDGIISSGSFRANEKNDGFVFIISDQLKYWCYLYLGSVKVPAKTEDLIQSVLTGKKHDGAVQQYLLNKLMGMLQEKTYHIQIAILICLLFRMTLNNS